MELVLTQEGLRGLLGHKNYSVWIKLMTLIEFTVSGCPSQHTVTMNSKSLLHSFLWASSLVSMTLKRRQRPNLSRSLQLGTKILTDLRQLNSDWEESSDHSQQQNKVEKKKNKKTRQTVHTTKEQHNPFTFFKLLARNSCVYVCNVSLLLPQSSHQLLGLPDLLLEELLGEARSSGCQAIDH